MSASRRRRTVPAIALLALLASLVGCGDGGDGKMISAGETTVLVSERVEDAMMALGGGRLEVVDGCLGASGNVIVWPHGTEVVDEKPLTIKVPGYGTFSMGDDVEVGGGFVVEHSSGGVVPGPQEIAGVTVSAACAENDIFLAS